jgi:hypothetical protein
VSAKVDLLLSVLKAFQKEGLLVDDLVLIGSWTHVFYSEHFGHPPEIPATRTLDLDFLVSKPKLVKREVDIPAILKTLDFRENVDPYDKVVKYLHPELELELLAPLVGPKDKRPVLVPKLKTSAQKLRYLDVLGDHVMVVAYKGLKVKVPEPAAYVLQKLLIQEKRKPEKKAKDMEAMQGISIFLLKSKEGKNSFKKIYAGLPAGWKKTILTACEKGIPGLHQLLNAS